MLQSNSDNVGIDAMRIATNMSFFVSQSVIHLYIDATHSYESFHNTLKIMYIQYSAIYMHAIVSCVFLAKHIHMVFAMSSAGNDVCMSNEELIHLVYLCSLPSAGIICRIHSAGL